MFSNIVAGKDLISKIYRSYNSIKNKNKNKDSLKNGQKT